MSVLAAQLDSGGTDTRWMAASAAAMGVGGIAMYVVGGGQVGQWRHKQSMDGGGAITMDGGDVIGHRWHKRSMDGGVSGDNGQRRKDTTV